MEKQVIIAIGREFGSAGHIISEKLAERFQFPVYDSNLLMHVADEKERKHEDLKKYDEKPKIKLFSRTVRGYSNSMQENVANMQFDYLKKMAAEGKSFIVVGRCAEYVLKDYECMYSIFITGNKAMKCQRIQEVYHVSEKEALFMMEKGDRSRKTYHNYYCPQKWGDSRNYDLCINSSKLGVDKTTDFLEEYIRARMNLLK